MVNMKKKIAVIVYTRGLNYDDRIRKEITALTSSNKFIEIKIFAVVDQNKEDSGNTFYGIPYYTPYLKTRESLPSGRFLLLKAFEFYFKIRKKLRNYDIIWCADDQPFLFLLLIRNKTFIWDLHEIPDFFLKNKFTIRLFKHIEKKCAVVIHANPFRFNYLVQKGIISDRNKHLCIRNHPDENFVTSNLIPETYTKIKEWLNDHQYVNLQEISSESRYPYNTLASILRSTDLKIIVAGHKLNTILKEKFLSEFGNLFNDRVYFTGLLEQLSTPAIIKNAYFSMVFYQTNTPNERFCEANRFYQPLVFGVPVITGVNEPLKEIVNKYQCGISIESDGSNQEDIIKALKALILDYNKYKINAISVKGKFIWNNERI